MQVKLGSLGQLPRLDRTLTKDGLTLTVIDAGVDGDEIVVSYSISPAEEEPDGVWARLDRGEIMLGVRVAGSGTSWSVQTPNSETDRVYGMVRAERPRGLRSLLWHLVGGRITLSLEVREREPAFDPPFDQEIRKAGRLLYAWEMSIPVRAVEVEPTVVPVNKELDAGKDIITLERLVFTPLRTVVEYNVRNAEPGDNPNRQYRKLLANCISTTTSDGRTLDLPGGSAPLDWGFEESDTARHILRRYQGRSFPSSTSLPDMRKQLSGCLLRRTRVSPVWTARVR